MFAVGYLDIGDEATAMSFFRRGYLNALDGAFGVWQETPSGGAVNFLTVSEATARFCALHHTEPSGAGRWWVLAKRHLRIRWVAAVGR